MKTHKTIAGKIYTVSCSELCDIKAKLGGEDVVLASGKAGAQFCFIAPVGSVVSSSDKAILTVNFNKAPLGVAGADGAVGAKGARGLTGATGADASAGCMPVVMLSYSPANFEFKAGVMHRYTLVSGSATITWADCCMEAHANKVMTCEICVDARNYSSHSIIWPSSWIWMDGQSAPDLSTGGLRYFSLRSDKGLSFIVEHTCYIAS